MASFDDSREGNVYNDLVEVSSIAKDADAGAAPELPPTLMPKKGTSFRQTSAILDRQPYCPPKPVPKVRKKSFNQDLNDSVGSEAGKMDFHPPIIVAPQRSMSSGNLITTEVTNPPLSASMPILDTDKPGRPQPVPRARTRLKKEKSVEEIGKSEERQNENGSTVDTMNASLHVKPNKEAQPPTSKVRDAIDNVIQEMNHMEDEKEMDEEATYENFESFTPKSEPTVLPKAPQIPPRPKNSQGAFNKPVGENNQSKEFDSDFDFGKDNKSQDSVNDDFFNFDAFSGAPAATSGDPWPGTDDSFASCLSNDSSSFPTLADPKPSQFSQEPSQKPHNLPEDFFDVTSFTNSSSNSASFFDLKDFDPLSSSLEAHFNESEDNASVSDKTSFSTAPGDSSSSLDPKPFGLGKDVSSDAGFPSDTSSNEVYSLGQAQYTLVQPKAARTLSHAPSFHFNPPSDPPPPLPRTDLQGSGSRPPPVPPRPSPNPRNPIQPTTAIPNPPNPEAADFFDLPTPVFPHMGDNDADPFQGSQFSDECYAFNKTLHDFNEDNNASLQASAISSTPSPVIAASEVWVERSPSTAGAEAGTAEEDPSQDPQRISRFVIPAPSSSTQAIPGRKDVSSSDSELGEDGGVPGMSCQSSRGWVQGGGSQKQQLAGVTVMDAAQVSPRKNQRYGYLYKQGGYNANKGWKKRWVVFNGSSLSYYDSNTSQVSKRIIPVGCMKEVLNDIKTNDKHGFKFKVVTTLQDRVFIFAAESLEDCVLWANSIMAAITEFKKAKMEPGGSPVEEKSDKEGFMKFGNMRKYYVIIKGHHLRYFRSFKDFQMGSPIHEIDMKLASVKVKDRKRCRLQLWLNYDHFELSFENDSDMQAWRMAMEDAIAEGLADDTVLEKVFENISNRECADCGANNPHWASINLGIVVCKHCAGIHRMFDYHVSKIRSLRMDTRVWTPSLIELMITVGNANSNSFWEYYMAPELRITPSSTIQERKDFIHKKYLNKKFCNHHPLAGNPQALGEELHTLASADNVLEAMKVLFSGADVLFRKDGSDLTAYDIAKESGQRLIMELLYQNCGDPATAVEAEEDENRLREDIRLQGYLNKTGPAGRTYDKRWCVLEHGALTYYLNEKSLTAKGSIDRKNMLLVQEVTLDRPGFHFEVSTNSRENRIYLLSSDSRDDAGEWMRTLAKLMSPIAVMDHVGMIDIKFAGYAHLRESISNDWKQSFLVFTWRGLYFMNKDLRLDYLDLRKASSIKMHSIENGYQASTEKGPCFIICCTGKSLYLQAPLVRDTEKMFDALLYAVKGSGSTLIDQALTNENVPVIVEKCVTHISKLGLDEKGIYRLGAQSSRIQALLEEFRKDAGAVVLESYSLNEVANVLKRFLRELEDSVFERINYSQWTSMAACKDVNNRLMWYKYYLEKMPSVNYNTLKRLVLHLSQVSQYESANQMSIINLATCFAPSLLRTEMDLPNLMSDISSREINIIADLIHYQDYFFQGKENERKINDNIRKAEKQIMQKMQKDKEGVSSDTIVSILTPVHMMNAEGPAVNILVAEDTKAQEALDYFKRSKATSEIDTSSFALFELISKGVLVRPLFPNELMAPTVQRWLEWEDWVKEDNSVSLCARSNELLETLDANYNATHILLSKLQYCDSKSKKFKRYTVGFRQCRLAVYTNPKAVIEVSSWNVEDLVFYIGVMPKKSPPTKHCLTFAVNGEKCSKTVGLFGHCLCFDTEDELYRWAAALYVSQHPEGFMAWNT